MKPCAHCGALTKRDKRTRYCRPCAPVVKKLLAAAWQDAHPEAVARYHHRYSARVFRGNVVTCLTEGCTKRFVRARHQGRRSYCDGCLALIYNPSYVVRRKRERRAA